MNVQEQIEKAFKAGAKFVEESSWYDEEIDFVEYPTPEIINEACIEYINNVVGS